MAGLMPEVRDYEPHMALDGGAGGLFLYRKFLSRFPFTEKRRTAIV